MLLTENSRYVPAWDSQAMNNAASGDWISLKGYQRVLIMVALKRGNDTTACSITLDKATDTSGSGAVAGITINNWWALTDYVINTSTSTLPTKGAAGTSIACSATASKTSYYYIDIDPAELGNYDCIRVKLEASNAANTSWAAYLLYNPRYAQAQGGAVEPIAD